MSRITIWSVNPYPPGFKAKTKTFVEQGLRGHLGEVTAMQLSDDYDPNAPDAGDWIQTFDQVSDLLNTHDQYLIVDGKNLPRVRDYMLSNLSPVALARLHIIWKNNIRKVQLVWTYKNDRALQDLNPQPPGSKPNPYRLSYFSTIYV